MSQWNIEDEDEDNGIYRDGESVRVSMMMMDSCQREIAYKAPAMFTHAQRKQLKAAEDEAAAVKKWADHFTGLQDGRTQVQRDADTNGQLEYERRLNTAWLNPDNGVEYA